MLDKRRYGEIKGAIMQDENLVFKAFTGPRVDEKAAMVESEIAIRRMLEASRQEPDGPGQVGLLQQLAATLRRQGKLGEAAQMEREANQLGTKQLEAEIRGVCVKKGTDLANPENAYIVAKFTNQGPLLSFFPHEQEARVYAHEINMCGNTDIYIMLANTESSLLKISKNNPLTEKLSRGLELE
jgi:hypothetical protein